VERKLCHAVLLGASVRTDATTPCCPYRHPIARSPAISRVRDRAPSAPTTSRHRRLRPSSSSTLETAPVRVDVAGARQAAASVHWSLGEQLLGRRGLMFKKYGHDGYG
jgi:hypothetical protein